MGGAEVLEVGAVPKERFGAPVWGAMIYLRAQLDAPFLPTERAQRLLGLHLLSEHLPADGAIPLPDIPEFAAMFARLRMLGAMAGGDQGGAVGRGAVADGLRSPALYGRTGMPN